jgi:chloramphenicol 3-O phosphotransferase
MTEVGKIVILNGAPRSGKSSIVASVQERLDGVWMNIGVDAFVLGITPMRYRPGIGLRPGGERPDLELLLPSLFGAFYDSIAAHSRLGLNVVTDVGHHDFYSRPLNILPDCARRLVGLPVLFVGVRCPIDVILQRREKDEAGRHYVKGSDDDPVPEPVRRWQEAVHAHGLYDLEVDTSKLGPGQCADAIRERLNARVTTPSAFERLAKDAN